MTKTLGSDTTGGFFGKSSAGDRRGRVWLAASETYFGTLVALVFLRIARTANCDSA